MHVLMRKIQSTTKYTATTRYRHTHVWNAHSNSCLCVSYLSSFLNFRNHSLIYSFENLHLHKISLPFNMLAGGAKTLFESQTKSGWYQPMRTLAVPVVPIVFAFFALSSPANCCSNDACVLTNSSLLLKTHNIYISRIMNCAPVCILYSTNDTFMYI